MIGFGLVSTISEWKIGGRQGGCHSWRSKRIRMSAGISSITLLTKVWVVMIIIFLWTQNIFDKILDHKKWILLFLASEITHFSGWHLRYSFSYPTTKTKDVCFVWWVCPYRKWLTNAETSRFQVTTLSQCGKAWHKLTFRDFAIDISLSGKSRLDLAQFN